MLVYGDWSGCEDPRALLGRISALLEEAAAQDGIRRHERLVLALIEAGMLAQGLADAEIGEAGPERRSPAQDAAMALVTAIARAVQRSWVSGFADAGEVPQDQVAALDGLELPPEIETKEPEGFAFYALYPEAYAKAATAAALSRETRVIGIRSIGTSLAAMVAAACGAPDPVSVRPRGHPFRREIAPAPDLADAVLAAETFAIVDEGPGLSGSSFGSVADWLEDRGVTPSRIHLFPSHHGEPGPEASDRHSTRFTGPNRHVVDFDALVLGAPDPRQRLAPWVADLVGEPASPLEEVSGGAWRARFYADEADWPAANIQQERRKFLLRTESGTWLLKFAGLTRSSAAKLDMARSLAGAGFTPEPTGLRHGFLVERWHDNARPLAPDEPDRDALVARIGAYLGFRARAFPAEPGRGASPARLMQMAERNAGLALGDTAAGALARWREKLPSLAATIRPIVSDNRMQAHEWLRLPDGRILKSDAVDHHAAHDLIGCQDIAWDVVGAAFAFGLDPEEQARLIELVAQESGRPVNPELVAFYAPCYLAFQLGACSMAAEALAGCPEEATRLKAATERYSGALAALLRQG